MNIADIQLNVGSTGKIGEIAVAVYRAGDELHVFENTCPHLRCELAWNSAGSVWECPCHFSRFSPDGQVLNGPARRSLVSLPYQVKDGLLELV